MWMSLDHELSHSLTSEARAGAHGMACLGKCGCVREVKGKFTIY